TQKKAFTLANRNDLFNILKDGFSRKQRDQALLEGLRYIDNTLSAHQREAGAAPGRQAQTAPGSNSTGRTEHRNNPVAGVVGWICIGLCVLLGIWLIVGLFRAITGAGRGYAGGPGYGGGGPGYAGGPGYGGGGFGGGGFFSGLLGGLFGAVAGNWLYNNVFGGHSSNWGQSAAYGAGAGAAPTAGQDDYGPSDQGQGFSNTGGDVDAGGGGGGDVEGGDAGGGGDWGGGGADTGGGG